MDSKCIINVQKTKSPTSKDNNPKILTSEKQRLLWKYIWNWNETLWKEASQNVCKNREICSKSELKGAYKSTQNALSIYQKQNTRHLRTILSKLSQLKRKEHYENISGIEMRPCEKKPVKMCAEITKYVLKMY